MALSKEQRKKKKKKFDIDKIKAQLSVIAKPSCKHCHGTGWIGWNRITDRLSLCRCTIKKIEKARVEKKIEEIKKKQNASKSGNKKEVHQES